MMTKCRIMRVLLVFILIGLWFTDSALSQEPELIARWPFDETSGDVVKDVVGGNNGACIGDHEWVVGKFGNGIQFDDKTSYVEVPAAPELALTESLTVIAWVKVNSTATGRQEIFCYADSYDIHIYQDPPIFKAYIHQNGNWPRANGKTLIETNEWYFVAMTYDGEDLKLYVNGELDGSAKLPGGIDITGQPLRFSSNPDMAQPVGISGILDEVEVWDKPMTDDQIMTAYTSPPFAAVSPKGGLTTTWGGLKYR